ncbi:ACSL4 [Cordylochernes scorpioides]|uniref:ACSL4 n=1 Tax=Cordylochernes scorpioides TaxID=51811 RepID=A0ABY6KXH7_9ARAC|nr:ACSL4 [Cordylochernes scorpioides]
MLRSDRYIYNIGLCRLVQGGLKKLEIPARYKLTTDSWTPANGLVTAAFKIRRKAIQDRYRADIEQLFHT